MGNKQKIILSLFAVAFVFIGQNFKISKVNEVDLKQVTKFVQKKEISSPRPLPKKLVVTNDALKINHLPTIMDLQEANAEKNHHSHPLIIEGARIISKKILEADLNQQMRQDTLNFLIECSEDPDLIPSLRAVCWKKALSKIPEWKLFYPISQADIPDEIQDLALKIN